MRTNKYFFLVIALSYLNGCVSIGNKLNDFKTVELLDGADVRSVDVKYPFQDVVESLTRNLTTLVPSLTDSFKQLFRYPMKMIANQPEENQALLPSASSVPQQYFYSQIHPYNIHTLQQQQQHLQQLQQQLQQQQYDIQHSIWNKNNVKASSPFIYYAYPNWPLFQLNDRYMLTNKNKHPIAVNYHEPIDKPNKESSIDNAMIDDKELFNEKDTVHTDNSYIKVTDNWSNNDENEDEDESMSVEDKPILKQTEPSVVINNATSNT